MNSNYEQKMKEIDAMVQERKAMASKELASVFNEIIDDIYDELGEVFRCIYILGDGDSNKGMEYIKKLAEDKLNNPTE